jgi:hypothetical protein
VRCVNDGGLEEGLRQRRRGVEKIWGKQANDPISIPGARWVSRGVEIRPRVRGARLGRPERRSMPHGVSVPNIAFVIVDPVFLEEVAVFVLKGARPVVFRLGVDVTEQRFPLAHPNREGPIALLPLKPE